MSYEEKIKIYQNMIRNLEIELKNYEGTPYFEDEEFKIRERINMHKEEIRLYNQAAKADKYEAKAKAFDEIKVYMQSAEDKLCDEEYFNEDVYEEYYGIIESVVHCYEDYESGEPNA